MTCLTGINSIRKIWNQLDDYESITPYGLEQLAKKMRSRGFESVGEAREYAKKNNIETITKITEKTQSHGFGKGM